MSSSLFFSATETGEFTTTYDALTLVKETLVPQAQPSANLYIIVFTDGESNGRKDAKQFTIQVASELKQTRAMKVMAVGVGVCFEKKVWLSNCSVHT